MIIRGSYMFEFNVSKDTKKKDIIKEVTIEKVTAHLCLTLIAKALKINVQQGRVVINNIECNQTLNIIFCVVVSSPSLFIGFQRKTCQAKGLQGHFETSSGWISLLLV